MKGTTAFDILPFFPRSTHSSGWGAPQPSNSWCVANPSLSDTTASAASQHHQPQRKLWSYAEGDWCTANTWATSTGRVKTVIFLFNYYVLCKLHILYRGLAKLPVSVTKGVRADLALHTTLGSQCGHCSSGAPAADVKDSTTGTFAHAHHCRQHPTCHCVPTGNREPCAFWQHRWTHW